MVLDEDAPFGEVRIDGLPGECMIDTGQCRSHDRRRLLGSPCGIAATCPALSMRETAYAIARADLDMGALHLPHEIRRGVPADTSGSNRRRSKPAFSAETIHDRFVTSIRLFQEGDCGCRRSRVPRPPVLTPPGLQT